MRKLVFVLLTLFVSVLNNQPTNATQSTGAAPEPAAAPQAQKVEYTADDGSHIGTKMDNVIVKEIEEARKVLVNRNHSQHYGFVVDSSSQQEFVFAVETDQQMQAMVIVYWEQDNTYIMGSAKEGQEIKASVYEDGNRLIGSWTFYHAAGIQFHAKKAHEYVLKFASTGMNKMIVMDVENYVAKGSSGHIASKSHVEPHEEKIKSLHQRLKSFLTVTETNHIINELIAENVRLHMNRYMIYQVFEAAIIFGFALAQVYFIRGLLTKGYSIV